MNKLLLIAVGFLGIILFVCAIIYFIEPARSLPVFFPGYDATLTKHHFTHGVALLILSVGSFVFIWFKTGKKPKS